MRPSNMKSPRILWALKSPQGALVPGDIHLTRRTVIREFVRRKNTGTETRIRKDGAIYLEPPRHTWKSLYREGWRVVKVEVKEVPQARNMPIGICVGGDTVMASTGTGIILVKNVRNGHTPGKPVYAARDGHMYCRGKNK